MWKAEWIILPVCIVIRIYVFPFLPLYFLQKANIPKLNFDNHCHQSSKSKQLITPPDTSWYIVPCCVRVHTWYDHTWYQGACLYHINKVWQYYTIVCRANTHFSGAALASDCSWWCLLLLLLLLLLLFVVAAVG